MGFEQWLETLPLLFRQTVTPYGIQLMRWAWEAALNGGQPLPAVCPWDVDLNIVCPKHGKPLSQCVGPRNGPTVGDMVRRANMITRLFAGGDQ